MNADSNTKLYGFVLTLILIFNLALFFQNYKIESSAYCTQIRILTSLQSLEKLIYQRQDAKETEIRNLSLLLMKKLTNINKEMGKEIKDLQKKMIQQFVFHRDKIDRSLKKTKFNFNEKINGLDKNITSLIEEKYDYLGASNSKNIEQLGQYLDKLTDFNMRKQTDLVHRLMSDKLQQTDGKQALNYIYTQDDYQQDQGEQYDQVMDQNCIQKAGNSTSFDCINYRIDFLSYIKSQKSSKSCTLDLSWMFSQNESYKQISLKEFVALMGSPGSYGVSIGKLFQYQRQLRLHKIDLSQNGLQSQDLKMLVAGFESQGIQLQWIESLDLRHNNIQDVKQLIKNGTLIFPSLRNLYLSHNNRFPFEQLFRLCTTKLNSLRQLQISQQLFLSQTRQQVEAATETRSKDNLFDYQKYKSLFKQIQDNWPAFQQLIIHRTLTKNNLLIGQQKTRTDINQRKILQRNAWFHLKKNNFIITWLQ